MPEQNDESSPPDEVRTAVMRMDGFFLPWVTDATALLADLQRSGRHKLVQLVLVQPTGVREFEKPGVLFVAGDRGTGKSSVLLKKAAALLVERDPKTYRTLRPHPPFVNELAQSSIAVPLQQYHRLAGPLLWEAYWRLALAAHYAALALRHRNVPNVGDTKKILGDHFGLKPPADGDPSEVLTAYGFFRFIWINSAGSRESLGPSMHKLVTAGLSEEEAKRWTERAEDVLSETLALDANTQFTIFVDAIDEAVGSPHGRPLFRYLFPQSSQTDATVAERSEKSLLDEPLREGATHDQYRGLASWMWRYAQTGFMQAAAKLWGDFSQRLWTYGAVRREAQEWFTDPTTTSKTRQKLEGNTIVGLSYTAKQLADIFALNVRFTPDSELYSPIGSLPSGSEVHCLFGFDHVNHPRVLGEDESLLDLMIRHTFMAPRQLVGIARRAKQLQIDPSLRPKQVAAIMDAIDDEARVVFEDFVANVSPAWTAALQELSLRLRCNVLTAQYMDDFEEEHGYPGFFAQLYSRGLLGIPKHKSSENADFQEFHRPNGTELQMESPPYAFLHPAFASHISFKLNDPSLQQSFYSSDLVVGEGRKCPSALVRPRVVVSYLRGSDRWSVTVDEKELGQQHLAEDVAEEAASSSEDWIVSEKMELEPLEKPEEHAKAAMMAIVVVACTMRRTGKHKVTIEEMTKQARDFEEAGVYGGRLCEYPLSRFPELHLAKEGGYVRTARTWLKAVGLNLGSSEKRIHSIRWRKGVLEDYPNGTELDPQQIRALPVLKRRGISRISGGG